jgi:hypothetical protein
MTCSIDARDMLRHSIEVTAFAEPGSAVPCNAKVNDVPYPFAFQFDDAQGGFHIVVEEP